MIFEIIFIVNNVVISSLDHILRFYLKKLQNQGIGSQKFRRFSENIGKFLLSS